MIVTSEFSPAWYLRNPHLQTIAASKLNLPPRVEARRERLELDDGDFLDLVIGADTGGCPVAIFHGLAGGVESSYVRGAFRSLAARDLVPCLMHWRGCSGEPNRLRRSYHSGATDDVARFVGELRRRFPGRPVLALGYSLGGNALIKYLGETGTACPLAAAMAVSPPLVLAVGADRMDRGAARLYRRYLIGRMRAQHEAKRRQYPDLALPAAGRELDSFWRFDDVLTAPLHGFRDVHDYYARSSARPFLPQVRRPLHVLCARDDPFFTPAILPEADELADGTCIELADRGGHVGFLGADDRGRPFRWVDRRVAEVLADFAAAITPARASPETA